MAFDICKIADNESEGLQMRLVSSSADYALVMQPGQLTAAVPFGASRANERTPAPVSFFRREHARGDLDVYLSRRDRLMAAAYLLMCLTGVVFLAVVGVMSVVTS